MERRSVLFLLSIIISAIIIQQKREKGVINSSSSRCGGVTMVEVGVILKMGCLAA